MTAFLGALWPAAKHTAKATVFLDCGSTGIRCWMGRSSAEGTPKKEAVLAKALLPSKGIHQGHLVDFQAFSHRLAQTVELAERRAGMRASSAIVGLNGALLLQKMVDAQVGLLGTYVSEEDLRRLEAKAALQCHLSENTVLHALPFSYILDAQKNLENPRGMMGKSLSARFLVIYVPTHAVQNMRLALEKAHLPFNHFVAAPYVAARSALLSDEKHLGAVLIDIGGRSTTLSIFRRNKLQAIESLPVGGHHMTEDLACGLGVSLTEAEHIKIHHASCLQSVSHHVSYGEAVGQNSSAVLKRAQMYDILYPRVEELFLGVKKKLLNYKGLHLSAYRFVLTGGGSQLLGLREVVGNLLGEPVRLKERQENALAAETGPGQNFDVLRGEGKKKTEMARSCDAVVQGMHDFYSSKSLFFDESQFFSHSFSFFRQIFSWFRKNL